jgi:hypothetical protein
MSEELKPPQGYRLYTVDASIEGRASIMFILKKELRDDWHLQGEVLNAAGEDIRQPLFITRTFNGYLEESPANALIDTLVEALEGARIMATEAYLDQDGRSIIAASDFKDIEQLLLQALAEARKWKGEVNG